MIEVLLASTIFLINSFFVIFGFLLFVGFYFSPFVFVLIS
ncbi:hypothetical protein M33023_00330 [Candidatus Phytoplasma asteris]|uniref:Uncharacterized protein n=1 Tax=Candidatus Phytoplasma asteris TaxID=85620 RepID=A0ABZ2YEA9_9MOLU